ncbi:MAG TPA: PKD domain-containing protein [Microlunatus sp.]|nr:PKD domain-containing protein [Microlunatus sp.]
MALPASRIKRAGVLLATAITMALVGPPAIAQADTAPVDPSSPATPTTVSADPLPTVQIDGVVWTQLIVGNTVYVGGNFTTARPAGAAPGVNTTPRANLLAYDITTGELISSWAPTTNGEVYTLAASPDNSVIYAGGAFTTVNGIIRNRIVALNPSTGAVTNSFQAGADASVRAIVPTADTVYIGGVFTAVNGTARSRLAAVQASNGSLLSWAPEATSASGVSAQVSTMALAPSGDKLLIGGKFTTLNGSSNPGYGLGAVDLTGNSLPWAGNTLVRDAGNSSGITALVTDGSYVYVSGYVFGSGGNLEGIAKMNWSDGSIVWIEDCHGDTYGSYPMAGAGAVYAVSHGHYCGNLPDGYPQLATWINHWATAFSKSPTQTLTRDPLGYPNWAGNPAPSLLKWNPKLTSGTFTGQDQAGWTVTGNDKYVLYGGEFPTANGVTQQGLVRYAVSSLAPNKIGPELTGSKINPILTSVRPGEVRVSWLANWDRDNENLTYKVIRDGNTTKPVYTTTALSSEWTRPGMGWVDTGLTPGQSYKYRLFVSDPFGNEVRSDTVTVTASGTNGVPAYSAGVLADGPSAYWRLGEPVGTTTAVDLSSGFNNATVMSGVTLGATGAFSGDTDTAATFNGTSTGWVTTNTYASAPAAFTAEAWIKTTTTRGGKIMGFGASSTGSSYAYDRQTYMLNNGRISFGIYTPSLARQVITTPAAYNDGRWHHVVSTFGSTGMALFVDGTRVALNSTITAASDYKGFWRIGGDNLANWASRPTSDYFAGSIDEVAIYPGVLTNSQISQHWTRGTGGAVNVPPTASFTTAVDKLTVSVDASGSSDPDGAIASYAWNWGDGSTGTGVTATHSYATAGTYTVTLTVTDNTGGTGGTATATRSVTTVDNVKPTAAFTSSVNDLLVSFDASGSADSDGTISSYAWDFGDGSSDTGKTPSHAYAQAGDYPVTLTVIDNNGATDSVSKTVTATAPTGPLAADDFGRTVSGGWGSATKGGAWSIFGGSSVFAVDGSTGTMGLTKASAGPRAVLSGVSSSSSDLTVKLSFSKLADGGGEYAGAGVRVVGSDEYRGKVKIAATSGQVTLYLTKLVGGAETTLTSVTLGSANNYSAGTQLNLRVQAAGTGTTTLKAKVWKVGSSEPSSWNLTTTDSSGSLQSAGGVSLLSFLSSTSTNFPISVEFDDLVVVSTG